MSVLILQNEIVHYQVLGRGKPLLFLHGWIGSWRYWMPAMQMASIAYRTFAIDLWGYGDTAKTPKYYSLEKQVQLIEAFMREVGITKVAMIGHALGALIAAKYAIGQPRTVDRLMAVSMPETIDSINPKVFTSQPIELAGWVPVHSANPEAVRNEAPKTDVRAIQVSKNWLKETDLPSLKKNLRTPCLFVYGQNDTVVSAPAAVNPDGKLPDHFHQIVFEESGYFPMLEEPNKFNRLLIDFLALRSGSSPRQLQLKEEWKRRVR